MEQRQPCEHDCDDSQSEETNRHTPNTESEEGPATSSVSLEKPSENDEENDAESKTFSNSPEMSGSDVIQPTTAGQEIDSEIDGNGKEGKASVPSKPRVVLQRLSSSTNIESFPLPKVNCPEKIIFCVDHSAAMFTTRFKQTVHSIKQTSAFQVLTGALKQYIMTKAFINMKHEFSLFMLGDDAQLITDFNQKGSEVLFMLQDIANNSQSPSEAKDRAEEGRSFDLSCLFNAIEKHAELPSSRQPSLVPPYIVRVILVYGRSKGTLSFLQSQESYRKLSQSPYFFVDCVYIHEEPDENNDVTEIFSRLCELDANGSSYVLEVSVDGSMSALYNALAKLTGHPLQRQRQASNTNLDISAALE